MEMMDADYDLKCPVARTLNIIGERWTILILRDLFREGPRRFQDFQRSLPGLSSNTLSARLKSLEEHGIITRKLYAEHPPRAEYLLTEKGRTLGPILKALLDWGKKYAQ
jgi:DNA-binding HxlR family transcriptional regulator